MKLLEAMQAAVDAGIKQNFNGQFFEGDQCACALGMAAIGCGIGRTPDVFHLLNQRFPELTQEFMIPRLNNCDSPRNLLGIIASTNDYDKKPVKEIIAALEDAGL